VARRKRQVVEQLSLGITEQLDELARARRIRALTALDPGGEQTWLQHKLFETYGRVEEAARIRTREQAHP
jgi:hypothetical protein